MSKELIVSATSLEKKIAILEDGQITEIFIERDQNRSILGNIYKGRVMRVLPGMQAAFVDIGLDRNAFLYVSDFLGDLDEYEELLKATDSSLEEFLAENGEDSPRQRGGRQRRGKGSGGSSRSRKSKQEASREGPARSEQADSVEKSSPAPAAAMPQAPATARLSGAGSPGILPDLLTCVNPDFLTREEEEKPRKSGILPLFLPLASEASPAPEKGEARLEAADDRQNLASRGGRKKSSGQKAGPMIGDLLKEGQEILVQIAKEPIGKKGARITSHIVFPGRYLVFMPTVNHVGVSRRIESSKERQRLREQVMDLRGDIEKGFIVRTAGEGTSREDLRQDMVYLTRLWEQIRTKAERASAPALIHSELDLVQRVIRDYLTDEFRAVRIDDEEEYERVVEFLSSVHPPFVENVRLHQKNRSIFEDFNVNSEIERALKSKVWLKNGGYIVLHQTEALVAIDVNTGKYVGKTNSLEDTITKTNMDAVKEVVRQIRLRDLGGIIVVDFIDMNDTKNQRRVLDALQTELRKDKSPSKVLPFNEFGLVAITRKRVKQSLERTLCQPCTVCDGTGMTRSVRTVCYTIHDEVRRSLAALGDGNELIIRCHPDVGEALKTTERRVQRELRELTGKVITVLTDPLMHIEKFDLVET